MSFVLFTKKPSIICIGWNTITKYSWSPHNVHTYQPTCVLATACSRALSDSLRWEMSPNSSTRYTGWRTPHCFRRNYTVCTDYMLSMQMYMWSTHMLNWLLNISADLLFISLEGRVQPTVASLHSKISAAIMMPAWLRFERPRVLGHGILSCMRTPLAWTQDHTVSIGI